MPPKMPVRPRRRFFIKPPPAPSALTFLLPWAFHTSPGRTMSSESLSVSRESTAMGSSPHRTVSTSLRFFCSHDDGFDAKGGHRERRPLSTTARAIWLEEKYWKWNGMRIEGAVRRRKPKIRRLEKCESSCLPPIM